MKILSENSHKGPGITDMKGGNVIILQVMAALKAAGVMDNIQVKSYSDWRRREKW